MTKETYLRFLRAYISNRLPAGEVEDIMRYYTEYFEDAGEGHEAEVMAELGSPEQLAQQIIAERSEEEPQGNSKGYRDSSQEAYLVPSYEPAPRTGLPRWTFILLLILAAICVGPVLLGLVLGLGGGGLLCIGIGIMAIVGGRRLSFAGLLYQMGGGLIAASVGVLLILGAVFAVWALAWLIRRFRNAFVEGGPDYEDLY